MEASPTNGNYQYRCNQEAADDRYEPDIRDDAAPERYQTGIMVLAKRLSEPKGIWALHGQVLSTDRMDHYFDVIGDIRRRPGSRILRREGRGGP